MDTQAGLSGSMRNSNLIHSEISASGPSTLSIFFTREIENLMPLKEPADKNRMFHTLLKGQALSYFEHYLGRGIEKEDSEIPSNDFIVQVLRS
jgi:hypothetical protein